MPIEQRYKKNQMDYFDRIQFLQNRLYGEYLMIFFSDNLLLRAQINDIMIILKKKQEKKLKKSQFQELFINAGVSKRARLIARNLKNSAKVNPADGGDSQQSDDQIQS